MWMLAELFETLPEEGDVDKPKLVFFFDEAHLLFSDASKAFVESVTQTVRLIRSKGVGVFFVTQSPKDIPADVLGQLGNRVQHALRAFTPRDQKAVTAAAETFRENPKIKTAEAIMELAVGEALISCLEENGQPAIVQRGWVVPPCSQIGPIAPAQRRQLIQNSIVAGVYDKAVDRESAYEKLAAVQPPSAPPVIEPKKPGVLGSIFGGGAPAAPRGRASGRQPDSLVTMAAKSAVRSVSSSIGRQIANQVVRGVLGSIFGGGRRR
jgi:DNA helicase HerA-like ATPase